MNITKDNFKLLLKNDVDNKVNGCPGCKGCCFDNDKEIGEFDCNSTIKDIPSCMKEGSDDNYIYIFEE